MPESLCFFFPIRWSAGREVVSCLLDRHTRWFVWQGLARGEKSQSPRKMYRKLFGISVEKYAGPFAGSVTVAYFKCARFVQDVLHDSPTSIAVINFDLTIIFILPLFLVEVFLDFLHQLLWLKLCKFREQTFASECCQSSS